MAAHRKCAGLVAIPRPVSLIKMFHVEHSYMKVR